MRVNVKSPDDALLYLSRAFLGAGYRFFGLNPLAVQFYPLLATVAFSGLVFLYISVAVDVSYAAVAVICLWWTWMFWTDHAALRRDSKATWTISLYRKYEALATVRRERAGWVRLTMLAGSLVTAIIAFTDLSEEMRQLSALQRAVFPLNMWALAFAAYCKSAELPFPDGGDFFTRGRGAQRFSTS